MEAKIYKCFISSPSDTSEERLVCDKVIKEINSTLGEQLGFRLESLKWEENVRPSFGKSSQDVINTQIKDEYDIFIGIMWVKFGTPTIKAGSGTEEEFNRAYDKYSAGNEVEIMFYFNDAPPKNISSVDPDQLKKVNRFKEKVKDLGGLYCKYCGVDEFQAKLNKHLCDYFMLKLRDKTNDPKIHERANELELFVLRKSISLILNNRLHKALCLFSNQPIVWIDPVLSQTNEISRNPDDNFNTKYEIQNLINEPKSFIIKAPPQFGLTCLSHYLVKEAWNHNSLWIYLDAKKIHRDTTKRAVEKELKYLGLKGSSVNCILLDSWNSADHGSKKLLKNLCSAFPDTPIMVMQTIDESRFQEDSNVKINRNFDVLHLLALPRSEIRKVVSGYIKEVNIGDEDIVLEKVTRDLEALNIHRTPLNCLTLLKVAEKHFDESPVNRTKVNAQRTTILSDSH